jgi:ADP-ribosylglycohydrolase
MANISEEQRLNTIRGCMIGGAAGDALGYAVEFMKLEEIYRRYPGTGITEYDLDNELGKGIISDDTQMTLFTAQGILTGATRGKLRGIAAPFESYIYRAYLDWLYSQTGKDMNERRRPCWLTEIKELCVPRAPGNTCISALQSGRMGTMETPINNSKGCGGVMRVAPIALYFKDDFDPLDGAKAAAITHGHPLGYMSAAALTFIIHRIVNVGGSLEKFIVECCDMLREVFAEKQHLGELLDIIALAVEFSKNSESDTDNITRLGQGWVAEETLAIALYCSLKYQCDFPVAIIAAANHNGDSDSTGAITGTIAGAYVGYESLPAKWTHNLLLHDLILEIADDLHHGCRISEYSGSQDDDWIMKYGS